jgi:hypothetical protein
LILSFPRTADAAAASSSPAIAFPFFQILNRPLMLFVILTHGR